MARCKPADRLRKRIADPYRKHIALGMGARPLLEPVWKGIFPSASVPCCRPSRIDISSPPPS